MPAARTVPRPATELHTLGWAIPSRNVPDAVPPALSGDRYSWISTPLSSTIFDAHDLAPAVRHAAPLGRRLADQRRRSNGTGILPVGETTAQ